MQADDQAFGWLRAQRPLDAGLPSREETRLLALAADQLALALRREDLRRAATQTEIARQSDALKSALLDAVSHDLRTPLASIRAAAGTLVDPELPPTAADARAAGTVIELEATRLDQLVRDVLDLSRIEGGGLRPDLEALDLRDVVEPIVERLRPALGEREVRVTLPDDLPPIAGDAVLLDAVVSNLVENAARHAPSPAAVAISAHRNGGTVELTRRRRRAGRPGRRPRAAVRQVLPRRAGRRGLASRDGHRPRRRPRPDRVDGRPGRRGAEPARRIAGRRRHPGRVGPAAPRRLRCPTDRTSSSSRTTSRRGPRSAATSAATATASRRRDRSPRRSGPGTPTGPTSSCSTWACRTATARR